MADINDIEIHNGIHSLNGSNKHIETFYDKWAEKYDGIMQKNNSDGLRDHVIKVLQSLEENKSAKILDVPCGTGLNAPLLNKVGYNNIDGCDVSNAMLVKSKEKNVYIDLFKGYITDTETMECEDGIYDVVLSTMGIAPAHINLKDGIKEFLRVLKPGGVMITTMNWDISFILECLQTFVNDDKLKLLSLEQRYFYKMKGVDKNAYYLVVTKQ